MPMEHRPSFKKLYMEWKQGLFETCIVPIA